MATRSSLAVSNDGLRFTKKGTILGLGTSGQCDDARTSTPTLFSHNGKIYCVYAANDGSTYRVTIAVSEDGLRFNKKGVVVGLGSSGECDDVYTYNSSFFSHNGEIYCAYSAADGSFSRTALAVSKDGFNFTKKGIIVIVGSSGECDDLMAYGTFNFFPQYDGKICCLYTSNDGSVYRSALAVSNDGLNFIKRGVIIGLGSSEESDDSLTFSPSFFYHSGKIYCVYGSNDGTRSRSSLASSNDGLRFTKKGIIVGLGTSGQIDDTGSSAPVFFSHNGRIYSFYAADD